jgi:hypothetical protein
MKSGRNEPCWCGSGQKFKKCHLDRHRLAPLTKEEMLRFYRGSRRHQVCLHPSAPGGCHGGIVRAHTIQRSGGLSRIARSGHVYSFQASLFDRLADKEDRAFLLGVRSASTFTGFCGLHDTTLFRPLETQPFIPTPEQVTLLAYRAVCMEVFARLKASG